MVLDSPHSGRRHERHGLVALAVALSILYELTFMARPVVSGPDWLIRGLTYPSRGVYSVIDGAFQVVIKERPAMLLRSGTYLVLMAGLVPWVVMGVIGRGRPRDLGLRRPNRYAWRFVCIGYVCSLPFQLWMVRGSGFAAPYLRQLESAGTAVFILYYCVNMLTEHFFLHGMILGVCRPDYRWPAAAPEKDEPRDSSRPLLRWLGLVQPTTGAVGLRRITRWMGLADGCVGAMLTSTLLFGLVHWGKNPRELVLSLPGGLALAYIAYRSDSWLTPFVLHLATAGTALLMIVIAN